MKLLLATVQAMESDHYKVQALTKMLTSGNLDATQQESLARAASAIKSDYYADEFLKAIAGARPMPRRFGRRISRRSPASGAITTPPTP